MFSACRQVHYEIVIRYVLQVDSLTGQYVFSACRQVHHKIVMRYVLQVDSLTGQYAFPACRQVHYAPLLIWASPQQCRTWADVSVHSGSRQGCSATILCSVAELAVSRIKPRCHVSVALCSMESCGQPEPDQVRQPWYDAFSEGLVLTLMLLVDTK